MKTEAYRNALSALDSLQSFTKEQYPVGVIVKSTRGRGLATFKVVGYPTPESIGLANSVIGESGNGKNQIVSIGSIV